MTGARTSHRPVSGSPTLWLCAVLAVAAHGALLFAWKYAPEQSAAATAEGDSVEVALVESAATATDSPPAVAPPQPAPEPTPAPLPEPPKKEPEMTLPEAPKPTPPPRATRAATPSPKATAQPTGAKKNSASKNSATAGTVGGASSPDGTAEAGSGAGKNAKASYVVRPIPAYPPESRAAGEHGVVLLRITVDGSGRPTAVSVAKSSGFPRLDRAAVEAGWRCRVRDAAPGAQLEAPMRFNLGDR